MSQGQEVQFSEWFEKSPWSAEYRSIALAAWEAREAEIQEQCRINGMGSEREAKLMAQLAECQKAKAELEAEVMEQCRLNGMGSEREAKLIGQLEACQRERDAFATTIRDAAVKVGVCREDAELTGPHLLMLCNDLAEGVVLFRSRSERQAAQIKVYRDEIRNLLDAFTYCNDVYVPQLKLSAVIREKTEQALSLPDDSDIHLRQYGERVREICLQTADTIRRSFSKTYDERLKQNYPKMSGNIDWARIEGAVKVVTAIRAMELPK